MINFCISLSSSSHKNDIRTHIIITCNVIRVRLQGHIGHYLLCVMAQHYGYLVFMSTSFIISFFIFNIKCYSQLHQAYMDIPVKNSFYTMGKNTYHKKYWIRLVHRHQNFFCDQQNSICITLWKVILGNFKCLEV